MVESDSDWTRAGTMLDETPERPSAWAPEREDEEEGAATKRMRLCPVTACNDMELRSDSEYEVK